MFEGQRLSYIVPGYTGYFLLYTDTFPKKYMINSNQSIDRNQSRRYQDTQDTFIPSNHKIFMAILSAKQLLMLVMEPI